MSENVYNHVYSRCAPNIEVIYPLCEEDKFETSHYFITTSLENLFQRKKNIYNLSPLTHLFERKLNFLNSKGITLSLFKSKFKQFLNDGGNKMLINFNLF